jgi:hypothetical protein
MKYQKVILEIANVLLELNPREREQMDQRLRAKIAQVQKQRQLSGDDEGERRRKMFRAAEKRGETVKDFGKHTKPSQSFSPRRTRMEPKRQGTSGLSSDKKEIMNQAIEALENMIDINASRRQEMAKRLAAMDDSKLDYLKRLVRYAKRDRDVLAQVRSALLGENVRKSIIGHIDFLIEANGRIR